MALEVPVPDAFSAVTSDADLGPLREELAPRIRRMLQLDVDTSELGIGPYGAAHLLAMEGRHDYIAVDSQFRSFVRATHFHGRNVSDRRLVSHLPVAGTLAVLRLLVGALAASLAEGGS